MEWFLFCFTVGLLAYVACPEQGFIKMATPAELAKLIANMKRGTALVDRAVATVDRDAAIMDRFEARLTVKDGFMAQVADYEKQMAAMDSIGNGGPPLDITFQDPPASPSAGKPADTLTSTAISASSGSRFDHATGDPVR